MSVNGRFLSPDKSGQLSFHSLKSYLDESDQKFADIWNIVNVGDDIFFRSISRLFKWNKGKMKVYQPSSTWFFLGKFQNKVIAHDEARGIMIYKNGNWELFIKKQELPENFYITSISDYTPGSSIITTSKNGLFKLTEEGIKPLTIKGINNKDHFTSIVKVDEFNYVLGTYNNGVYLFNEKNEVIESFTKQEGLQNLFPPLFTILIYPVISFQDDITHIGSRDRFLGKNASENDIRRYSSDNTVTESSPPAFLVHCSDDLIVSVENSLLYYKACLNHNVSVEMHVYAKGGHGFGMHNDFIKEKWMDRLANWLLQFY